MVMIRISMDLKLLCNNILNSGYCEEAEKILFNSSLNSLVFNSYKIRDLL